VIAALSARVGSIGDNRKGGWYGYRASKAALNQLLRTAAIEIARSRPEAIVLGLHPGTVATDLSRPYTAGYTANAVFSADESARHLLAVVDGASVAASGSVVAWDGESIPP
jgi:NAD(P)-dependent dehydrogenase (short-subunit alcohol dehydrogenase family)